MYPPAKYRNVYPSATLTTLWNSCTLLAVLLFWKELDVLPPSVVVVSVLGFYGARSFSAGEYNGRGNVERDDGKIWITIFALHFAEDVKAILKQAEIDLQAAINEVDGMLLYSYYIQISSD